LQGIRKYTFSWHTKCIIQIERQEREEFKMEKAMKGLKVGVTAGLIALMASPAFARSISMKEGGTALWIFIIIGAIIVLLQLIPAAILFFSFIGTATTMALKKEKKVEEEVILPNAQPVAVKK
jgi:hypothetical protein